MYHCGSMLIDVSILMDIDMVRTICRFDPASVSVYYLETTGDEDDDVVSRRIEQQLANYELGEWEPYSAAAQFLGASPSTENPLTQLFRALDQAARGGAGSTEPETAGPPATPESRPETTPDDLRSRMSHSPAAHSETGVSEQDRESPVEVRSADDWAEQFDNFTADLDLFLTLMTGIGVVIAVLSIVNTMLMSVTERRIEFGILRANGWSHGHVLRLVTFESALLGIVGGVLGAALGWCATHVVNWCFPERVHLYAGPGLLAFSLAFSTLLGMAGGVYPAWLAARLSPMEAIRRG